MDQLAVSAGQARSSLAWLSQYQFGVCGTLSPHDGGDGGGGGGCNGGGGGVELSDH